ncbi:transmembrane protein 26 [Chelonus insularis]|uniref:transmembrane protein 26 n=1 Tax=Chelonus insularis TaxID=460826 RepID=UPI0015887787|nr:transmembrane protein 26 [Chelonus insularis]
MVKFIATIKAIITRIVFAAHGFIAVWQVTTFKKNPFYWYLSTPIVLLFFEGIFTVTIKANQEWKWFCPSVFLYLTSVVPAIWLLELDKLDQRMLTNINISETLDLTNLAAKDLKHLEKVFGVNLRLPEIQISTETWVTLIEQFLMLVLIIGRWMLPKGDLTRDQLSQLLLVYIGTAADIIEFFDSFKEDKIARELLLVYLTLGIWSWSLMQFTVVLTATKSRKARLSSGTTVKRKVPTETSCCSIDVWAITLNMILQDAPFLAFRLLIIIHYRIVSYMNIFFTCKNTLVILLQLYRLYVVESENRIKKRNKWKSEKYEIPSISIVARDDMYGYKNSRRKRKRNANENQSDSDDYFSDDNHIYHNSHKKNKSASTYRHKMIDNGESCTEDRDEKMRACVDKKKSKKVRDIEEDRKIAKRKEKVIKLERGNKAMNKSSTEDSDEFSENNNQSNEISEIDSEQQIRYQRRKNHHRK